MGNRRNINPSLIKKIAGCLLFVLTVGLVAGSRWVRLNNSKAIAASKTVHIYLQDQTALPKLANILVDSGLVTNKKRLFWAANMLGWNVFQEGHYQVDQGFTYDEFLSKLAKGIQDPISLTILPGRSESEVIASVSNQLQFDSLSFRQALMDSTFLASRDLEPKDLIGHLYPNTYSIYWTASPQKVIKRILDEFDKAVIHNHKNQFNNQDSSIDKIITLASIIEWEAGNDNEKKTISGLYWNRLKKGMPLQSDPTINFALGERRRLLYEDYKIDHPYNTYTHTGLPPGPITNPSLSSIEAALNPKDNAYLYMVASPDGSHSFSRTFKEHKQKSAKWRKWIEKQYRIKHQRERARDASGS